MFLLHHNHSWNREVSAESSATIRHAKQIRGRHEIRNYSRTLTMAEDPILARKELSVSVTDEILSSIDEIA